MKDKKQFKKSELKQFKKLIMKDLKKAKKQSKQLTSLYKDQKKYIAGVDRGVAGNSKYMGGKAMLKKLRKRSEQKVEALKDAKSRIENGTYGICVQTGELISKKRLLAKPTAKRIFKKK